MSNSTSMSEVYDKNMSIFYLSIYYNITYFNQFVFDQIVWKSEYLLINISMLDESHKGNIFRNCYKFRNEPISKIAEFTFI